MTAEKIPLPVFVTSLRWHDWWHEMSDDHTAWPSGWNGPQSVIALGPSPYKSVFVNISEIECINVRANGRLFDTNNVRRFGSRHTSYTVCHTVTNVDFEWYGGMLINTRR